MSNKNRFVNILIVSIFFAGLILSVIQFAFNRSLWLDESFLAISIVSKTNTELLKPLLYNQVAPVLYLQIEKIFSLLTPGSEYGLRILPLLAYLFSMIFIYLISKLKIKNSSAVIFALSLFAINYNMIYYSNEVKQYMTDVFSLTCMYYFVLKSFNNIKYRYYTLGFTGVILIFLSNVSPIILFSAGLYLIYEYFKYKNSDLKYISIVFIIWAAAYITYFSIFISGHPAREVMLLFWTNEDAFLPLNPFKIERELDGAQATIDMLDMLKTRTVNNIEADESRFLEQVIADLKLNYVEEKEKKVPEVSENKTEELPEEKSKGESTSETDETKS